MPDPDEQQQAVDSGDTPGDAPDTAPQPLPDNLDVEELLSMGSGQPGEPAISMVAEPGDDDEEDEEGDTEEDEDDSAAPPADGDDAPAQAGAPTPEAVRDAGAMLAESPQRINELPKRQRAAAIEEAMRLAYVRGGSDMFVHQTAQASQEAELRTFYDERAAARADDPEEFALWEDEHPEESERYAAARRYFKAKAAGQPAQLPGSPTKPAPANGKPALTEGQQMIQNLANREAKRLHALPQDVQEAIAAQGFALTEDGIEAFRQAISDAEAAARRGTNAPGAAARRQGADQMRRGTARVDTGQRGNATPPKRNPIADINDPDALMEMAVTGAQNRRRG